MGDQDESERRKTRLKYRKLIEETQKNQHDLVNPESDELHTKLLETNAIYDHVKMTREAALDSQMIALLAGLGKQKVQQLHTDFMVFQPVEFVEKLKSFVGGNHLANDDNLGALSKEHWANLGAAVQPFFKQSPSLKFMFGSFDRDEPQLKNKNRKKKEKDENIKEKQTVPTLLKDTSEAEKKEATTEEVERVLNVLQEYYEQWNRTPICYFEFVVNPDSFGQTIENMFYVSFLVRDGFARIFLDDDKLPVIEPVERQEDDDVHVQSLPRHQVVMSLSYREWKDIISKFQIKEPLIPTREVPESQEKVALNVSQAENTSETKKTKTGKKGKRSGEEIPPEKRKR